MTKKKKYTYTEEDIKKCNRVEANTDTFKGSFKYDKVNILKHSNDMSLHFYDRYYAPMFNCKISDITRIVDKKIYVGIV